MDPTSPILLHQDSGGQGQRPTEQTLFKMPKETIIKERLTEQGLQNFAEGTIFAEQLAQRELEVTAIEAHIKTSLENYFYFEKGLHICYGSLAEELKFRVLAALLLDEQKQLVSLTQTRDHKTEKELRQAIKHACVRRGVYKVCTLFAHIVENRFRNLPTQETITPQEALKTLIAITESTLIVDEMQFTPVRLRLADRDLVLLELKLEKNILHILKSKSPTIKRCTDSVVRSLQNKEPELEGFSCCDRNLRKYIRDHLPSQ